MQLCQGSYLNPQVPVADLKKARVHQFRFTQRRPARYRGRQGETVALMIETMQPLQAVVLFDSKDPAVDRVVGTWATLFVTQFDRRKASSIVWVGFEKSDLGLKLARAPDVVRILKCDVSPASLPESQIAMVNTTVYI